jgi:hypothetical protein
LLNENAVCAKFAHTADNAKNIKKYFGDKKIVKLKK